MMVQTHLAEAVNALDREALKEKFLDQDEFIVVENFLPQPALEAILEDLERLRPSIHRNFIPNPFAGSRTGWTCYPFF